MKVLGVTGGIACGKSTATAHLKQLGARVWDADAVSRRLTLPGRAGAKGIMNAFGKAYFNEDGTLDRKKLAGVVFSDGEALARLNAVMHPLILQNLRRTLARYAREGVKVAVVDAPLLFETGIDRYTDEIWVLSCGVDEQLLRLLQRGLTPEEAAGRIEAQMSDTQRRARANRVIDTSGAPEDTQRALTALYEELLEEEE